VGWSVALGRSGRRGGRVKPGSQALHCQPQLRAWWERASKNEAALRVVAYGVRRFVCAHTQLCFRQSNAWSASAFGGRIEVQQSGQECDDQRVDSGKRQFISSHEQRSTEQWLKKEKPFLQQARVSELSPVLTGAPLDVRHGDNNGYVGWPVFPGALGTRKACLCFFRFGQRAADR
jgi:hypothetical protein